MKLTDKSLFCSEWKSSVLNKISVKQNFSQTKFQFIKIQIWVKQLNYIFHTKPQPNKNKSNNNMGSFTYYVISRGGGGSQMITVD